jgi:hypothetical protein
LLEIESQARRYVKPVFLSHRWPRGGRPETYALQARELSTEIDEIMPVTYANGEIIMI